MTQMIGKQKVTTEKLRVVSATTTNGAAQNKGTTTDLLLTIDVSGDGATAFAAGTTSAPVIQGANASSFAGAVTVVPDKGTLPAQIVAVGTIALHFAQLAFQFYRLQDVSTGAPVQNLGLTWNFQPTEDSFDATVQ